MRRIWWRESRKEKAMKLSVDEEVKNIPYYPKAMMYGLDEGWVRLSSNENGNPPSGRVMEKVLDALFFMNRYPGGELELKTGIAARYGIAPEQVIIGNGSNELIETSLKAMRRPQRSKVIISEPSFAFYSIAAAIYGYDVVRVPLEGMKTNLETIEKAIDPETRVIFLNNPNNPAGTIFEHAPFEKFLERLPGDLLVVVDEAYAEFVESRKFPQSMKYLSDYPVVVLRTFSKAYGLAGLRVGYGLGEANLISYFERTKQPFSVNMVALVAAMAALEDDEYLKMVLAGVHKEKKVIYTGLKELNLEFVPTEANFVLFKVGDRAEAVSKELFNYRILVRWMGAYGLPDYLRVTIGRPEENQRFLEALKKVLG
jgi:histidinol-phosphate aminotransferase